LCVKVKATEVEVDINGRNEAGGKVTNSQLKFTFCLVKQNKFDFVVSHHGVDSQNDRAGFEPQDLGALLRGSVKGVELNPPHTDFSALVKVGELGGSKEPDFVRVLLDS
jgi:hypothetical protein